MQRAAAGLGTLEGYSGCSLSAAPNSCLSACTWQAGLAQPTLGVAALSAALLLLLSEQSADGTRLLFLSVCSLLPVTSGGGGCTRLQHLRLCPAFC